MGSAAAAAAFLASSHGLVRCRDLRKVGVDGRWIRERIRCGVWVEVFPGVVDTTGRPLTSATRVAAACLATGLDGRAAAETAAGVYGLVPMPALDEDVHVAVPHGSHRVRVPGIVIHQDRYPVDVDIVGGIPVVGVSTMLSQLARPAIINDLRCVAADAVSKQLVTIDGMLTSRPTSRSAGRILRLVAEELMAGAISGGEAGYWRAVKDSGLPLPELNALVRTTQGDKYVDGVWRKYGLAHEIDGRSVHAQELAFVNDRRRQNAIHLEGLVLIRFAVSDVFQRPDEVVATTRAALQMRAAERGLPWPPKERTH